MTARTATSRTAAALAAAALTAAGILLTPAAAHADHEDPPTNRELLEKCGNGTDVCEFHPEGEPETHLEPRQLVIDDARNCSTANQQISRNWSTSSGEKNSVGTTISVEGGFFDVFTAKVKHTFGSEWRTGETVGGSQWLTVAPGKVGQMYYTAEMQTVRGTYELHFPDRFHGHYIWYVPFEATQNVSGNGDATSGGNPAAVSWEERDMTDEERAEACDG